MSDLTQYPLPIYTFDGVVQLYCTQIYMTCSYKGNKAPAQKTAQGSSHTIFLCRRGSMLSTAIFVYAATSPVNGYFGGSLYAKQGGNNVCRSFLDVNDLTLFF